MADRSFYEKFRQTPEAQGLLRMLRFAEGTERGGQDSYRVMFGGSLAPDLKRHPDKVIKGGKYASAAAGAYQFMPGTWQAQQKKLGLESFGSVEQDIAALDLARQRTMGLGGLSYLQKQGLTPEFVAALAPEWASLPTKEGKSYYGQPVKSYSELQKTYQQGRQPLSGEQAQGATTGQETSSTGFLQGFLSAMEGSKPKDLSVGELVRGQFLAQLLTPAQPLAMDPFQMLLNMSPYG
jgi:muramidase (phage lysozyme)